MKHVIGLLTFLVVLYAASPPAYCEDVQKSDETAAQATKVVLKSLDIGDSSNDLVKAAATLIMGTVGKPTFLQSAPRGVAPATSYFQVSIGAVKLVLGLEYNAAGSKLYLDGNGGGDLSQARPVQGVVLPSRSQVFPNVPVKGPNDSKTLIRLEAPKAGSVLVYPATAMSGTAQLDGKAYRIFVVDANLNGNYGDCFTGGTARFGPPDCDFLAVDLNGNRRFDRELVGATEVMPMPRKVYIGKNFYSVTVAADGTSLELSKVEAPVVGTVDLGKGGCDLMVYSDSGAYHLAGDGECKLPAGKYLVESLQIVRKDKAGATWVLNSYLNPTQTGLDISAGQTTALKYGGPVVPKVTFNKTTADTVSIGFRLIGVGGESYALGATRNGLDQPAPKIRIVDGAGNVLNSGTFSYG